MAFHSRKPPSEPVLPCPIAASPQARARLSEAAAGLRGSPGFAARFARCARPTPLGMDDGLVRPPPRGHLLGERLLRRVARSRTPRQGPVRVLVVLVDFPDRCFEARHGASHYRRLFFGGQDSVRSYFHEASGARVDIVGEVYGPLLLPHGAAHYANNSSGVDTAGPNAQAMARDAARLLAGLCDLGTFDNQGLGYVDAFVVVHAGRGAEETLELGDVWSHKWVLPEPHRADGTKVWAYATVPEDARLGVCCHEIGHLLFGWPDLHDGGGFAEGVGRWCLMGTGSWNGGGDTPAHPSAWCKAQQGWVDLWTPVHNDPIDIQPVATHFGVYRLWREGRIGPEHFLVEHRRRVGFDRELPGEGLLLWHIDESVSTPWGGDRPFVALVQADGRGDLEAGVNGGDASDPFPGGARVTHVDGRTTPDTRAWSGGDSCVCMTDLVDTGESIHVNLVITPPSVAPRRTAPGSAPACSIGRA